jgi:hypothetical protein
MRLLLREARRYDARVVGRGARGILDEHGRNPSVELVELSKQVVLSSFELLQETRRASGGVHRRGGSWMGCVIASIAIGAPNRNASTEFGATKKSPAASPNSPAESGEDIPVKQAMTAVWGVSPAAV